MRRYACPTCNAQVHFNNTACVVCDAVLGYVPLADRIIRIDDPAAGAPVAQTCANRGRIGCNWLCEPDAPGNLCLSCQHTTRIPDITDQTRLLRWGRLERAKRRLFYSLIKFDLPLDTDGARDDGFLHFQLLGDETLPNGQARRVMTGHANGRVTINIDEADDAIRERNRTALGEPYRTLIGHFRHEVAHYYWDKMVLDTEALAACRACFGDDTQDYGEALRRHYAKGPTRDWQNTYVSEYASAHPWEDFAETWAHYFHMVSGLETAFAYGINPRPMDPTAPAQVQLEDPYHQTDVQELIDHWVPLTVAMNAMNRSMGNRDFYPFVLSQPVLDKLTFVHDLIGGRWAPA
ncbi:putative zinc-binding metallopeptidase [Jannaschia sp. 2305UL9-9]|uniref:zinc-binding metallopeptidase family protein n=1 Tax=Jannaschia sp. 2305UL9-9 TaxID=3121638 RepID=UPI003527BCD4